MAVAQLRQSRDGLGNWIRWHGHGYINTKWESFLPLIVPSAIRKSLYDLCRAVLGTEMLGTLCDVVRQGNQWSIAQLVRAVLDVPSTCCLLTGGRLNRIVISYSDKAHDTNRMVPLENV